MVPCKYNHGEGSRCIDPKDKLGWYDRIDRVCKVWRKHRPILTAGCRGTPLAAGIDRTAWILGRTIVVIDRFYYCGGCRPMCELQGAQRDVFPV